MDFGPIIAAAIPSVIAAIGGGIKSKADAGFEQQKFDYQKTQDASENAYKYAALAQAMEIARMNAGAGNASAGAALAAARITDARERLRMKQEAAQALLAGRLRSLEMLKPEVIGSAQHDTVASMDKNASRTQEGFLGLAQLLQQPFSQIGKPTFGR